MGILFLYFYMQLVSLSCTVWCVKCSVVYTMQNTQYAVHSVQSAVCNVQCAEFSVHYAVCGVQFALWSPVCNAQFIVYRVQCTYCTVLTIQYTLLSAHYTQCRNVSVK